jgi:hypothetical protein
MSVEQAWENIVRGVALTDPTPAWANVEVRDGRMVRVLPARLTPAPSRERGWTGDDVHGEVA